MSQDIKDWVHYGSAIGMLISCVVLTFISFLTLHLVHNSVLMYVALCITFAAATFGVTLYFRNSLGQFGAEMMEDIRFIIRDEIDKHVNEKHVINTKDGPIQDAI